MSDNVTYLYEAQLNYKDDMVMGRITAANDQEAGNRALALLAHNGGGRIELEGIDDGDMAVGYGFTIQLDFN